MSESTEPGAAVLGLSASELKGLFSLDQKQAEDRIRLSRLFRCWCGEQGLASAAFYSVSSGIRHRRAQVGPREFPRHWGDSAAEAASEGLCLLELPAALLVFEESSNTGAPPSAGDPQLQILAAASRISRLKEHIQEQSFQANFRGVELEALYDVGLAIASTLDLKALGEEVLIRAVSLLDARRGALYLYEAGAYRLARTIGGRAVAEIKAGQSEVYAVSTGRWEGPVEPLPGASHIQVAPVEIDGKPRGLLVVADKESRRGGVGPFQSEDRRTLALFANQAAIALENAKLHKMALEKERLEREMELASEIQKQILPKAMPDIPGYEVVGWNRPARQVGGDYFDLRELEGGRFNLVVGDVTGKGMPAALMVSTFHSALRLLSDRLEVGGQLAGRLNAHIHESSNANKFITMLLAELEPVSGVLRYANAGHNPGLLLRVGGEVEELPSGGLPLGLMPRAEYQTSSLELGAGDLLCLYSDGITECESAAEEEYGLSRLVDLLREHSARSLDEIICVLDETMLDFARGRPQGDDQTVLLLRRRQAHAG